MKTRKCKVAVYDCKKHKLIIEEREMPVYEPTPPKPLLLETVIYNICSLLKNKNITNEVIDEFLKFYENTYGKKSSKSSKQNLEEIISSENNVKPTTLSFEIKDGKITDVKNLSDKS